MRILVTGASGMLGSNLAVELSKNHNVYGTGNSKIIISINYQEFDLFNNCYDKLIQWSKPELIIHCAAITNGDYCEFNSWEAFKINGFSVKKLMEATHDQVKIIYISTDAVFPSSLNLARESDCKFPESVYGKSKELGEFFLTNSTRKHIIVRTTIVGINSYSNKSSFVQWILKSVKEKQPVKLFDDVLFTPISIWDFIDEVCFIINNDLFDSKVLHISGSESISKYEFGYELIKQLNLDTRYIKKGRISEYKNRFNRSNNQTLDSSYYEYKYNRKVPDLKGTIKSLINNLKNEN